MTNITEVAAWDERIHQIERGERVEGGLGGVANVQAAALANRTLYLKKAFEGVGENTGFQYIGQVPSYAALKQIIPSYAGQRILLESHADHSAIEGWAALAATPKGHGQFVAINTKGVEDGGTVAAVNDEWHWRRIIDGPYQPEWFGAGSGTGDDDMIAIGKAVTAAAAAGVNKVRGEGIYTAKSSYTIPAVRQNSPVAGGYMRQGLELYLNVLIVDAPSWPSVPVKWWDAKAVFYPAVGVEHLRLTVNEFDGGGKATFFHSRGGSMATSRLHIGNMRNHIIGVRNLYDMGAQATMVNVTGYLWQDGYIGILNGGTGNGGGNSECWGVDVTWLAAHRYGGVSLQDRSQYAHIKAGTIDYNGRWSAMLTLSNVVQANAWSVQFGDTLTANGVSGFALSNVMNCRGEQVLHITEATDKHNGVSDYAVGATIRSADGAFTATISAIALTSDIEVRYFDVIASNVSGGFSRVNVTCTYGGGTYGANMFTNQIWAPNSVSGVGTSSYMGLEIGGSSATQLWYIRDIYGVSPLFNFDKEQMQIGTKVTMGNNAFYGYYAQYLAKTDVPVQALVFPAAENELLPHVFEVNVASSIPGASIWAMVHVRKNSMEIVAKEYVQMSMDVSGLALSVTISGTGATLSLTVTRKM